MSSNNSTVSFEKTQYNHLPYKFEAGTPNIAGVIGLGSAIEYFQKALTLPNLTNEYALNSIFEAKREICDWNDIDNLEIPIISDISAIYPNPFNASLNVVQLNFRGAFESHVGVTADLVLSVKIVSEIT